MLLFALAHVEANTNSLGIDIDVATDPDNRYRFVTRKPKTDWSLRTLDQDQRDYYGPLDKTAAAMNLPPVSRAGHLWSAYLRPEEKG